MDSFLQRLGIVILSVAVAILLVIVLAPVLPPLLAVLLGFGVIGVTYYWTVRRILPIEAGSSYEQQGQSSVSFSAGFRLVGLLLAGVLFFAIFNAFLPALEAMVITIVVASIVVLVVDRYFSAGMEEELRMEREHQRLYTKALGSDEERCQSCREPLDAEGQFCPNCGFERREFIGDKEYVG